MKFYRLIVLAFSIVVVAAACGGEEEQALSQSDISDVLVADGLDFDIASCAAGTYSDASFEPITVIDQDELERFIARCEDSAEALVELRNRTEEATELAFVDSEPFGFGDDEALDLLWTECEAGEGESCDELFDVSVLGSEYEQFGLTCGNRDDVLNCQDLEDPELLQPVPEIAAIPQFTEDDAEDEESQAEDAEQSDTPAQGVAQPESQPAAQPSAEPSTQTPVEVPAANSAAVAQAATEQTVPAQ